MALYKMSCGKLIMFIFAIAIGIFFNYEKVLSHSHYEVCELTKIIVNSTGGQKQITIIIANNVPSTGRFWRIYLNSVEDNNLLHEGKIDSALLVKSFKVDRNINRGDVIYLLIYNEKRMPVNISYISTESQGLPIMDLIEKYLGFILGTILGVFSSIIINRINERSREKFERRRESTKIDSSIKMAVMDLQDRWHSINRTYILPPLIQGVGLDLILSSVEKYEEVFNEICEIRKIHKLWEDKGESPEDYKKLKDILDEVSSRFISREML